MNKKEVLEAVSNVSAGMCLGIIVDFLAHTTVIFTLAGTAAGVVLAIVQRKRKKNP